MSDPIIKTSKELKDQLRAWPFECESFLPIEKDARYALVPKDWFPKFAQWCRDNPLDDYSIEDYDCDDMAGDRVAEAGQAFRAHKIAGAAPAFFWLEFRIVPTSNYFGATFEFDPNGHAACVCYADDGFWYVYEPQANEFKNLGELMENHVVSEISFVAL